MGKLYQRLFEIYDYIEDFWHENGYSPSQADIAAGVGITTPSVMHNLKTMEILGMIERPAHRVRAIKLLSRKPDWDALFSPLES
jgi:SOS-response transcriptional repressor LexA